LEHLSITLSDASGVPYYRQIMDQVAQLIRSGQLAPNTQLPSVRELASQLLVSLITVRRSYADLEAAGLIKRRQGHGTFVAEEVVKPSRDQAIAEARGALEGAVNLARRLGVKDEDLKKMLDDALARKGDQDG
jgi:GntR family transcriptional regulator